MKVTILGAGNSGLAMAAHLGSHGENVTLWNRSKTTISKLMETHTIYSEGVIEGEVKIDSVTTDIKEAIKDPDVILVTTPASSHKDLAEIIAKNIKKETLIVLNPGRTFGALEFKEFYKRHNDRYRQTVAETQTIIHTCRKTSEDSVNIIAMKNNVLISTFDSYENNQIISNLPDCIQEYFMPAKSMVETSIGNVGMILHCAPLLLNAGWTESNKHDYKYYFNGISPSVARFLEKIDNERIRVSRLLGTEVESTEDWLKRTYDIRGNSLYECIQNNKAYETIDAPDTLKHRYIFEDIPTGLVPLESAGRYLGLSMTNTSIVIDLASALLGVDFRFRGRNLTTLFYDEGIEINTFFNRSEMNGQNG